MKKGDIINIWTQWGITQDEIKSIGRKYITTERYKFHSDTFREVNGCGHVAYIIEDLEEYYKNQERRKIIVSIKNFNFEKLTLEDAIKIQEVLNQYKTK